MYAGYYLSYINFGTYTTQEPETEAEFTKEQKGAYKAYLKTSATTTVHQCVLPSARKKTKVREKR